MKELQRKIKQLEKMVGLKPGDDSPTLNKKSILKFLAVISTPDLELLCESFDKDNESSRLIQKTLIKKYQYEIDHCKLSKEDVKFWNLFDDKMKDLPGAEKELLEKGNKSEEEKKERGRILSKVMDEIEAEMSLSLEQKV